MTTNLNTSAFLNELAMIESDAVSAKLPPAVFQEELDEVRYNFIRTAKRELEALHSLDDHARRTKYGFKISSWWEQRSDGRFQVCLKDGTSILALQAGKTVWLLPSQEDACRFIAAAIEAAEKRELDAFLTVKPKKKSQSHYEKYLAELRSQRRQQNASAVLDDASAMPDTLNQ